jgi:hypothetical protein
MYKVAKIDQNKGSGRSFLLMTYKLYHHLDTVGGVDKGNCLNVILSLLKYAWKKNDYQCGLRHSTIADDTRLSRTTIYRTLLTLTELNIVKMIKGRSGKSYRINALFLNTEKTTMFKSETSMFKSETKRVSTLPTLEEQYIKITNIQKIMKKGLAKDAIIKELSELPFEELKSDKTNIYYCNLAITLKEELLREKNLVPTDKILTALKNTTKKSNSRYVEKVEYNKRNNLDYKGNPK